MDRGQLLEPRQKPLSTHLFVRKYYRQFARLAFGSAFVSRRESSTVYDSMHQKDVALCDIFSILLCTYPRVPLECILTSFVSCQAKSWPASQVPLSPF